MLALLDRMRDDATSWYGMGACLSVVVLSVFVLSQEFLLGRERERAGRSTLFVRTTSRQAGTNRVQFARSSTLHK